MSGRNLEERLLQLAFKPDLNTTSVDLPPAPKPTTAKAALRRCCAAWQRSYNAHIKQFENPSSFEKSRAADRAADAYRNAMPLLSDYEGIRDFIACTAHGILVGAIKPATSGQLLYAAQIALNSLPYEARRPNPAHKQPKQPKNKILPPTPLPKTTRIRGKKIK